MQRQIESVAVLGAVTMGSRSAGPCAAAGARVLLLDLTRAAADRADAAMSASRRCQIRRAKRRTASANSTTTSRQIACSALDLRGGAAEQRCAALRSHDGQERLGRDGRFHAAR